MPKHLILAFLAQPRDRILLAANIIPKIYISDMEATAYNTFPPNHTVGGFGNNGKCGLGQVRWKWHGIYFTGAHLPHQELNGQNVRMLQNILRSGPKLPKWRKLIRSNTRQHHFASKGRPRHPSGQNRNIPSQRQPSRRTRPRKRPRQRRTRRKWKFPYYTLS